MLTNGATRENPRGLGPRTPEKGVTEMRGRATDAAKRSER
jgi:hypothetical protein